MSKAFRVVSVGAEPFAGTRGLTGALVRRTSCDDLDKVVDCEVLDRVTGGSSVNRETWDADRV